MEPLVRAAVFTAVPGWLSGLGGVLSVVALAASAVIVAGTAAGGDSGLLASGRGVCVAFTGLLAAAGFVGLFARWAFAVACVACLLALLAVALRYGQGTSLRGYLERRGGEEEPAWWPVFERGFRRYASTQRREQNPLRRAVPRPRSASTIPDRGLVAGRSIDGARRGRP